MSSSVGNTIQQLLNNSPVDVSVGDKVTVVATKGGNVYHSGFVGGQIASDFSDSISNIAQVGHITQVAAADGKFYLLNAAGSVFEYDYNRGGCEFAREVYSPAYCCGDKAIKLSAGDRHVLILTDGCKVFGVGDNTQYQLVPQGQCRYDSAVEILVTDTVLHDPSCEDTFSGILKELETPVLPGQSNCNGLSCVKELLCDTHLGYLNFDGACVDGCRGILSIPLFGDVDYSGVLCIDKDGCVTGQVNYALTRLAIKCGAFDAKFTSKDGNRCHIKKFKVSSTKEIEIFRSEPVGCSRKTLCDPDVAEPIQGTTLVAGKCGGCATMNIVLPPGMAIPGAQYDGEEGIILALHGCRTTLAALCDTTIEGLSTGYDTEIDLDTEIALNCAVPKPVELPELPQPEWKTIAAGGDVSVLVDSCNLIYALGSLHTVRSNRTLAKDNNLEELLNQTKASISFPATQLNCNREKRDDCGCAEETGEMPHHTDLSKFDVQLDFPNSNMSICDFLQRLKLVNEGKICGPTCEPCSAYITLNIGGDCKSCTSAPAVGDIGSISIYNKKSIDRAVSRGACVRKIEASVTTVVEFNLTEYCVDTMDVPLDNVLQLTFCNDGPHVNVFVDTDNVGGIQFAYDSEACNIEFPVQAGSPTRQYILNYGGVMDPVLLTNLKRVLHLDEYYPSAKYKNPFDTKITNTYLRGGDVVKFVIGNYKNVRQAVTADVATVFRLSRRIIDIAVGEDNITALVGGMNCPNEVMTIGYGCAGQLGLGNRISVTVFKNVNRCLFDCQVIKVFAAKDATFYVTQSHTVYATGQWRNWINSTSPAKVDYVCPSWKVKKISISDTHAVLVGEDGSIFGLGRNNVGELGLRHVDCVEKPIPLSFFYELNGHAAHRLKDGLDNPLSHFGSQRDHSFAPHHSSGFGGDMMGGFGKGFQMPQMPDVEALEAKFGSAHGDHSVPHHDAPHHAPRAHVASRYNPNNSRPVYRRHY